MWNEETIIVDCKQITLKSHQSPFRAFHFTRLPNLIYVSQIKYDLALQNSKSKVGLEPLFLLQVIKVSLTCKAGISSETISQSLYVILIGAMTCINQNTGSISQSKQII